MTGRLWVASELYYPEETSTGYFVTMIAESLTAHYHVAAIAGRPSYDKLGTPVPQRERHGNVDVHRLPGVTGGKDRLILRGLNLILFSIASFVFGLRHFRRGDVALVVTNPPSLPFAVLAAAKLRGAKTVLLVHDVYPDILAATKMVARTNPIYRLLEQVFRGLLRRCDRVIVLGRDMRDLLAAKMGDRASRIRIIPNWGDIDLVSPASRDGNTLRAEFGFDTKFIVQVSGNLGRTHDLDIVLAAASRLRENDGVRFLLVGQGGKLATIHASLAAKGLTNVTVLPRQPRDRLTTMLTCSDLTLIPFVSEMVGLSVPSRMYNVMAAGVPIAALASDRSELALVVAEEEAGWICREGDAAALTALITRLAADPQRNEARRRGDNGRRAVEARFAMSHVLTEFATELGTLNRASADDPSPPSQSPRTPTD